MKYGLIYYKDTDNIGDDIQAYAASQFLPRIDYFIDRDQAKYFVPNKKEYVYTIMNGWYTHNKYDFGFSPYIVPLLVSMHFKNFSYEDGITFDYRYLNENLLEYLRKYGPVGARDFSTLNMLKNYNVESYFSGCLTLTIQKFQNIQKKDYICAVNLSEKEVKKLKKLTDKKIIEITQDIEKGSLRDFSWAERSLKVEELLKIYQAAFMVITTKLHCALPCLALETPVLLLYSSKHEDRFSPFLSYLNYIPRESFMHKKNILKNFDFSLKIEHSQIRNTLINTCKEFINNLLENVNKLPEIEEYKKEVNYSFCDKKEIISELKSLSEKYVLECQKSDKIFKKRKQEQKKYEADIESLKMKNRIYESDIKNITKSLLKTQKEFKLKDEELQRIYNSKTWLLISKIRKIFKR